MKSKLLFPLMGLIVFIGCGTTNYVKKYHQKNPNYDPGNPIVDAAYEPWSGSTRVINSTNWLPIVKQNYHHIGNSLFYGGEGYDLTSDIHKFGREIKADIALWQSSYRDTQQGSAPVYSWVPGKSSTTTSTGNINSNISGNTYNSYYGNTRFNASGNSNYSNQSTTTSSGYMTVAGVRNYSVNRNNFQVAFYRKAVKPKFGFQAFALDPEEQKSIGGNHGLKIAWVIIGSRFFEADVMDGDIMLEVNSQKIHIGNWEELLVGTNEKNYTFKFKRGDEEFKKNLEF